MLHPGAQEPGRNKPLSSTVSRPTSSAPSSATAEGLSGLVRSPGGLSSTAGDTCHLHGAEKSLRGHRRETAFSGWVPEGPREEGGRSPWGWAFLEFLEHP